MALKDFKQASQLGTQQVIAERLEELLKAQRLTNELLAQLVAKD